MRLLLELGYIKDSDFLRSKELEIYRAICFKIGNFPTPETIANYLARYPINVTGVSVNPFVGKILGSAEKSEEKNAERVWLDMYSLFKKALPKQKTVEIAELKESEFPENMISLLVIQPKTGFRLPHIIFGRKKDGKFETIDSSNGDKTIYPSFLAFMQASDFSGVYFDVSKHFPTSEIKIEIKKGY
jgi:hypothetical protein